MVFSKIHPACYNIVNGIKPGSDSEKTDKHTVGMQVRAFERYVPLIAFYTILVTGYTDADCNPSCSSVGNETEPLCNTTTQKCLYGCIEGFAGEKCQFKCSSNCSDCTVNE